MNTIDLQDKQKTISPEIKPKEKEVSKIAQVVSTLKYIFIALIIVIPIRTFVAQPFIVQGNSMYPTLRSGEYLIVNETVKITQDYRRGDVVILHYPNDPSRYFVKRVIGLPGETVSFNGYETTISGPMHEKPFVINEPYVAESQKKIDNVKRTLSDDEFFVCGDNRAQSSDSRVWGPVPRDYMDGRALIRLFPFSTISLNPGSLSEFDNPYNRDIAQQKK